MIWDVNQSEPWKPAKVFDSHGVEITNVIRMDTETGEVEQIAVDRRGRVILGESGPETIRSVYPAPLRVVECEEAAA